MLPAHRNSFIKESSIRDAAADGLQHYTVLVPMDDGNWHVTVYCPASLGGPLLDKDSNEFDTDDVKPGDKSYTVANPFHLDHAPGTDGFIFGPDTLRR